MEYDGNGKTWTVVQFIDDTSVAAVPTSWINVDNCVWPPFPPEKLTAAIKSHQFNSCWPSHKVKVFRDGTYDSYETARLKCRKAEDTSDLNTTDVDESHRKRRFYKKRFHSSSESDSEVNEPVRQNKGGPRLPSPLKPARTTIIDSAQTNMDYVEQNQEAVVGFKECITKNTYNTVPCSVPSTSKSTLDKSGVDNQCKCYCPLHAQFNAEILRQLYFLKSMVNDLRSEIKDLKANQRPVEEDCGTSSIFVDFQIPFKSTDHLEEFEEFLKNSENFQKVESELCKWGGGGLLDFIKRCLGMLVTNELALNFSWLGRRDKKGFCNFQISRVIISAAVKSGKCRENKEAEQEIARWLRRAPARAKRFNVPK